MRFKEWWSIEEDELTANMPYPALKQSIRHACYLAWMEGANQGRQNASKGGKLYNLLRKFMSNRKAAKIAEKIAGWLF